MNNKELQEMREFAKLLKENPKKANEFFDTEIFREIYRKATNQFNDWHKIIPNTQIFAIADAYESGYGYISREYTRECPYRTDSWEAVAWQYGKDTAEWHNQREKENQAIEADLLLKALGLDPIHCRTEGGYLNYSKIKAFLAEKVNEELVDARIKLSKIKEVLFEQ